MSSYYFQGGGSAFRGRNPPGVMGARYTPPRPRGVIAPQNQGAFGSGFTPYGGYPRQQPIQPAQAPQAPQPAAAQSPGYSPSGPGLDLSSINYQNDPTLARVRALSHERVQAAEADALAQRQQLVVGYGDPGFAQKLGLGGNWAQLAQQNPFSTVAELARTYQRRNVFDVNRPLSDYKNLFYSTERGRQLGLSSEQNLRDQSTAERAVQERLQTINQAVVQARMQAQADEIQAQQDAYNRAVQAALYGAYGG